MPDPLVLNAVPDRKTVTPAGESVDPLPDGVVVKDLVTHTDERGSVCVLYDPREGLHPDPLVYTYCFTIRPDHVKGWNCHDEHDDRYTLLLGHMKVVLYDAREDSPTRGLVASVVLSEHRRRLITIPTGIWHADWNVGTTDVVAINHPTTPYDYERPDKKRLPIDTDLIPYEFPPGTRGF
jgi:dTDP-4-dehydrorhamnose 3,5-epimerase